MQPKVRRRLNASRDKIALARVSCNHVNCRYLNCSRSAAVAVFDLGATARLDEESREFRAQARVSPGCAPSPRRYPASVKLIKVILG